MSIIQVLDSKGSRAIYLVAGAIICGAIFRALGIAINLSLDSISLFTTCVSGLSLILLASKLDVLLVERYGLKRLWSGDETRDMQLKVAFIMLFVKPWEGSLIEARPIVITIQNEYRRTVRSQEFSEQVGTFHQIFWSMLLSIPSFYLASSFLPQIGLWWIIIGAGVTFAIVAPPWYRDRNILQRIRRYALVQWLNGVISSGLQRREVMRPKFPADNKEVLEIIANMTKETMQLVVRKDWNGFERSSKHIDSLVGSAIPDSISIDNVESYFRLLEWVISNNSPQSNVNIQLDRSIKNASILIGNICATYRRCCRTSLDEDEDLLIRILEGLSNHFTDLDSFIAPSLDVFAIFDRESITLLSETSYQTLLYLPFSVRNLEKPTIDEKKVWIVALAQSLVEAAESNLLDTKATLELISSWGVTFWQVSRNLGLSSGKVLWESGLNLKELSEVASQGRGRTEIGSIARPIASYLEETSLSEVESRTHELEETQDLKTLIEYFDAISSNLPLTNRYIGDRTDCIIGDFLEEKVSELREKLEKQEE